MGRSFWRNREQSVHAESGAVTRSLTWCPLLGWGNNEKYYANTPSYHRVWMTKATSVFFGDNVHRHDEHITNIVQHLLVITNSQMCKPQTMANISYVIIPAHIITENY